MEVLDVKKLFKQLYSGKPGVPELVDVPDMQFLMVDGKGDPNTSKEFQDAVGVFYSIAYTIKFDRKKSGASQNFGVGALEGLWWDPNGEQFSIGTPQSWSWTLMMWMPDFVTANDVHKVVELLVTKKPNPALKLVRLERFKEGQVVQIMHIGPYATEPESVAKMHAYAKEYGLRQSGKHHEVYLGDPRRAKPEKLRTILRHPVTATAVARARGGS